MAALDAVKAVMARLDPEDRRELATFLRGIDVSEEEAERLTQRAQDRAGARIEGVRDEWRRCGKPRCACHGAPRGTKGRPLHGPYKVRYYYDDTGRRRREHLGRA